MVERNWCVVGAWHLNNSLQVYKHMRDRGSLSVEEFGDAGNGEWLGEKRQGRDDFGEIGEVLRSGKGL